MVSKESNTKDIGDIVHERWLHFTQSFGNNGFFEEGVVRSMHAIGHILTSFFGEEIAKAGLDDMVYKVLGHQDSSTNWDDLLEDGFTQIYSETRIGQLLHDLTAYADYGIVLATARDAQQREKLLRAQVEQAVNLLELLPLDLWKLEGEHLARLIRKSAARWKLDNGEPVNAKELALVSGRALQTIKNKLAGKPAEIIGNQNRIDAHEALAWLGAQADFYTSIWRDQDDTDTLVEQDRGLGQVLFLPVAKDGSVFHPGVQRDGKYLIDEDGKERATSDFKEALAILQSMYFPQWRRPTQEGVWTRVRAAEWRRYDEDQLDRLTPRQGG